MIVGEGDWVWRLFVLGETFEHQWSRGGGARGITMRTNHNFLKTRVPVVGYLRAEHRKDLRSGPLLTF